MCVICAKGKGVAFPEDKALKNCWDNNPDMGGFMTVHKGQVVIRKGFMNWKDFKKALDQARKVTGDNAPYVMHFRISTQGYQRECCQPFPLSAKMENLKKLKSKCNIGVCHNGILHLTSDGSKEYSDTMKFVTDYLSLIIRSYSWWQDKRNTTLIERLIEGSRFAILDKNGHIETLGQGWVKDGDLLYSNNSYARQPYVYKKSYYGYDNGWWDDWVYDPVTKTYTEKSAYKNDKPWTAEEEAEYKRVYGDKWLENIKADYYEGRDYWETFKKDGQYDFGYQYCPLTEEDDDSYCFDCKNNKVCPYYQAAMKDIEEQKDQGGVEIA